MEGILVFNVGLDEIRSILFDSDGVKKAVLKRHVGLKIDEEYAEQDPGEWYQALIGLIGEALEKYPDVQLSSITVNSMPGTVVCVDNSGNSIMDAVLYCDSRAKYQARFCEKNFRKYDDDFHIPWSYMVLPKVLWLKHNKPDVYKKIFKIFTPESYLSYRLCGEASIDNYSALFFGYNIKNSSYNTKLLSDMEIDVRLLPQVMKAGECAGFISGEAKEKLGLKYDVKFILSSNNIINLACIQGQKNCIFYDTGSSLINYMNDFAKVRRDIELIRLPAIEKGSFVYSYICSSEMRLLKYLENDEPISGKYVPGSGGVFVLPYMLGEGISNGSDERCSILGINENTEKENIKTAFYESIGYILRDRINRLLFLGYPVESIEIASEIKDELFFKVVSDITGRKVIINNEEDNCLYGGYCTSSGKPYNCQEEKREISPDEDMRIVYNQFYSLYWNAFSSLLDVYRYRRKILRRVIL